MENNTKHCGYVAIIGRPNVGKSTLLNKIIEHKVSITSAKPQTTRHKILGVKTTAHIQTIYVDTPGIHDSFKRKLNRHMNKIAWQAIEGVDVIVWVIAKLFLTEEDEKILKRLHDITCPVIMAINKIDEIKNKEKLLPYLEELHRKIKCAAIIPLSATKGINVDELEEAIAQFLPVGPFLFPQEQFTDRDEKFLAAEIVREKLFRFLGKELPYVTAVIIEKFCLEKNILHINATIIVEGKGQKAIVIGKQGEQLKKIGTLARKDLEQLLGHKVFLTLWVKIKDAWSDDAQMLEKLGY